GARLDAGSVLPAQAALKALTWPRGVPLPGLSVLLAGNLALPTGALIPSMTDVKLPGDALSVPLRTVTDGRMGRNWAVGAMLPEGSLSWSLRLVAGADTAAADTRTVQPWTEASLVLADTHYSLYEQHKKTVIPGRPGGAWYWNEAGAILWGFEPNTPVPVDYEWACDDAISCARVSYLWDVAGAELWGFTPNTPVPADYVWACADVGACISLGEPIPEQIIVGEVIKVHPLAQNFSVLRTGTGDLDLIAGGDVATHSLYGIYTAGTSTASRAGAEAGAFDRARGKAADGTYLGTKNSAVPPEGLPSAGSIYESLVNGSASSTYAAWYPDGGGNLLLRAGGDLKGDLLASYEPGFPGQELRSQRSSADIGNWLWRQASGGTAGVD
ncbi:MAG: hypothetical protein ACT6SC_21350, partial [Blastomonas fulva]